MVARSDRELVDDIRAGRREALGTLFDRYSPPLYEFIYLLSGDRSQSARLLEQVFARAPAAFQALGPQDSIRGWLYSLAREATLAYLSQRGWLEALPALSEPAPADLRGDIWRAARAMPAFLRAVLIVEELHGLSPTEKARALNVARTDWPRVVEDARRAFTQRFDEIARQQGLPPSSAIDPERAEGIQRRAGMPGSLFGYLPVVVLPDALASTARSRVLSNTRLASAVTPRPATLPPPAPPREPSVVMVPDRDEYAPTRLAFLPEGCSLPAVLTALVVAMVITAIAACVGLFVIRDSSAPTITRVEPAENAVVDIASGTATTRLVISASFQDNRAVDIASVRLFVDNRDVTTQALITGTSISYPVDLAPGQHTVLVQLRDTSGNPASRAWQFTLGAAIGPTPTETPTLTATPLPPTGTPTLSPTPTNTPPPLPVINAFTASETNVPADRPVTLSWSVAGADIVFLNQDRVDPVSSRTLSLKTTTTFHLIANNAGGTVEKAITITVQNVPDVTVSDIAVSAAGQLSYTIKNLGPGDVTQMFLIQVFVDNTPVDSNRRVASLPAGQDVTLSVPNYTFSGTHLVTVRLNATQEILETNFGNNDATRTLTGPAPTPTSTGTRAPTNTPTRTATPPPSATATRTPPPPPTNTPTATAAPVVVTGVTAALSSTSPYTGTCPATFTFTGTITTNGPTVVIFRWDRSDGLNNGPFSLVFTAAGTQTFTNLWLAAPAGASWTRLHVLTPNDATTPNVNIQNNCH